jgi:hypothetical protein
MQTQLKLVTIFALVLLGSGFTQVEWPTFKSTEENFVISLPAEPKQERNSQPGPFGNGHHIYTIDRGGIDYTISNSSFDNPPTQSKDIKQTLDFARDLVRMVTNGKLLSDKEITFDGFTGREVKIEKNKRIWTLRAYIIKKRMYQLMTTEPKGKEQSPEVAKFFESFKLINSPE